MATSTSPIIRLDMRASRSRRRVKRNYAFSAISAQAKFVLKNTGKWSIDHLKGVEGAEETKEVPRIEMLSGIKTIGRVTDSRFPHDKVVINAPTVSGDHARLSVLEGQLYCEDLVRSINDFNKNTLYTINYFREPNILKTFGVHYFLYSLIGIYEWNETEREKN